MVSDNKAVWSQCNTRLKLVGRSWQVSVSAHYLLQRLGLSYQKLTCCTALYQAARCVWRGSGACRFPRTPPGPTSDDNHSSSADNITAVLLCHICDPGAQKQS